MYTLMDRASLLDSISCAFINLLYSFWTLVYHCVVDKGSHWQSFGKACLLYTSKLSILFLEIQYNIGVVVMLLTMVVYCFVTCEQAISLIARDVAGYSLPYKEPPWAQGPGILEIKCPFNKGYPESARPYSTAPYYYMPQVHPLTSA